MAEELVKNRVFLAVPSCSENLIIQQLAEKQMSVRQVKNSALGVCSTGNNWD